MRLEGTLETFPLRELVEMVMYSSVTGVLEVYGDAGPGRLFFDDGRPYHAVCGERSGIEAVRELFTDPAARFLFIADITISSETLWIDPLEMLDQCQSRAQRLLQARAVIPDLTYVPHVVAHAATQVSIAEDDWPLLSVIDGQRTISQLAEELSCDVVEVCESIQRMIERGQVRLSQPQLRTVRVPEAAGAPEALRPRGLLDRLLDSLPDLGQLPPAALAPVAPVAPSPDDDPIVKLLRNS